MERDFWEQFIDIYRSYPCLWNPLSREYLDKKIRSEAYNVLIMKCRELHPTADKEFVMKKIHSFRCSFRREHKKVLMHQTQGIPYTPTLWNYGIMAFIADDSAEENEKVFSVSGSAPKNRKGSEESVSRSLEEEYLDFTVIESSEESYSSSAKETPSNGNSAKRKILTPIKSMKRKPPPEVETLDACNISGNQLAADLRSLNPDQRTFAEKIIQNVIYYAKLGKLGDNFTFVLENTSKEDV